jgi:hypothetical protein
MCRSSRSNGCAHSLVEQKMVFAQRRTLALIQSIPNRSEREIVEKRGVTRPTAIGRRRGVFVGPLPKSRCVGGNDGSGAVANDP